MTIFCMIFFLTGDQPTQLASILILLDSFLFGVWISSFQIVDLYTNAIPYLSSKYLLMLVSLLIFNYVVSRNKLDNNNNNYNNNNKKK